MPNSLERQSLPADPFRQFETWLQETQATNTPYPEAMSLATASPTGEASSRVVLLRYFDPMRYFIKITPVNPTGHAVQNGLASHVDPYNPETAESLAQSMRDVGYQTLVSIGDAEENKVGSNCGPYVLNYLESKQSVQDGYTYQVETIG